jgi:hypothetical protein
MSDWARKQVDAINKKGKRRMMDAEARILEDKLKREQGELLWEQLRKHLQAKSEEINREARVDYLKVEPSASYEFRIRLKPAMGVMTLEYSSQNNAGNYKINQDFHRFETKLLDSGEVVLCCEETSLHPEEFAELLLEKLIEPLKQSSQ